MRWFASRPPDVGNQTRAVLSDAQHGTAPAVAAAAFQTRQPDAAGNGALMRTGPVALAFIGDRDAVARLAADAAALTHPHPDSVDACVLWSLAIEQAITTARPDEPFDWCTAIRAGLAHIEPARRTLWTSRLDDAAGRDPADFHRSNGWVVGAFQAASRRSPRPLATITGCRATTSPRRCGRRHAPAATPTPWPPSPAPCSAHDGARQPSRWHGAGASTADAPTTRRQCRASNSTRSPAWPCAPVAPTRKAGPASRRWATAPRQARHVELDGAWFGNHAGLGTAVDAGATVVVSLCRMGADDVPAGIEHHTIGLIDSDLDDNPNITHVLLDTAQTIGDLVDDGEHVFVHCVHAEHRAPTMAAAYLITRGADSETAIRRARTALGGAPQPFMRDALIQVEQIVRTTT